MAGRSKPLSVEGFGCISLRGSMFRVVRTIAEHAELCIFTLGARWAQILDARIAEP
jgi:hypothetical protein